LFLTPAEKIGSCFFKNSLFMPDPFVSPGRGGEVGASARHEKFEEGQEVGYTVLNRGTREEDSSFRGK
jgi:hypothetical protein